MHTPMGGSEEAEEGKGKSTVSCEWTAGPARWLTGLGLALSKTAGGEFVFTAVTPSISSSSPFPPPPPPNTHTHTSHPDTCTVMCPTLHLEARLPAPQGSRDLSLILLPDLWLSISHQPPSAPQSIYPTLADLTSSSLTFTSLNSTLYYLSCSEPRYASQWEGSLHEVGDLVWSSLQFMQSPAVLGPHKVLHEHSGMCWAFYQFPAPLVRAATESKCP